MRSDRALQRPWARRVGGRHNCPGEVDGLALKPHRAAQEARRIEKVLHRFAAGAWRSVQSPRLPCARVPAHSGGPAVRGTKQDGCQPRRAALTSTPAHQPRILPSDRIAVRPQRSSSPQEDLRRLQQPPTVAAASRSERLPTPGPSSGRAAGSPTWPPASSGRTWSCGSR